MAKHLGRSSMEFSKKISISAVASTVGTLEGKGPLKQYFDAILTDNLVGLDTWEKAESKILTDTFQTAVNKGGMSCDKIDYVLSGDLLNQCSGSSIGVRSLNIPFLEYLEPVQPLERL